MRLSLHDNCRWGWCLIGTIVLVCGGCAATSPTVKPETARQPSAVDTAESPAEPVEVDQAGETAEPGQEGQPAEPGQEGETAEGESAQPPQAKSEAVKHEEAAPGSTPTQDKPPSTPDEPTKAKPAEEAAPPDDKPEGVAPKGQPKEQAPTARDPEPAAPAMTPQETKIPTAETKVPIEAQPETITPTEPEATAPTEPEATAPTEAEPVVAIIREEKAEQPPQPIDAIIDPIGDPLPTGLKPGHLTLVHNPTTASGRGEPTLEDIQRPCAWFVLDGREGAFKTDMLQWYITEPVSSRPTISIWVVNELLGELVDVRITLRKFESSDSDQPPRADLLWQYSLSARADGLLKAGEEYPLCTSGEFLHILNTRTREYEEEVPELTPGNYAMIGYVTGTASPVKTLVVTYFTVGAGS